MVLSVSVSDTSIIRLEYGLDSLDEGTLDEKVKIIAEEEEIDWYEVWPKLGDMEILTSDE